MRRVPVLVMAATIAAALLAAPVPAADGARCTAVPFSSEVLELRIVQPGPAEGSPGRPRGRLLARTRGTTTLRCEDGSEAPLAVAQELDLRFPDVCFQASDLDLSTIGKVRGQARTLAAAATAEGERTGDFRGPAEGTIGVDPADGTRCLLDLALAGRTAEGGGAAHMRVRVVIDRDTQTVASHVTHDPVFEHWAER